MNVGFEDSTVAVQFTFSFSFFRKLSPGTLEALELINARPDRPGLF